MPAVTQGFQIAYFYVIVPPIANGRNVNSESAKTIESRPLRQALGIGTAALVIGLDSIGFAVALASLMFAGNLSSGLALGVTAVLACSVITSLVIGSLSQLRTNIAGAQDIGAAILAVTLLSAVASVAAEMRVATAFAIIAAATLATGILMLLVGFFKGGRLVRFFPLEVLAGFMAATGCLLLMGGIAMVAQVDANFSGMLSVTTLRQLVSIIPAVLLAVIIYYTMAKLQKPFLLLGILLFATAAFHLWRYTANVSLAEAAAAGWLPEKLQGAELSFAFPTLVPLIDWSAVLLAAPTIATVATLSLFAALMNVSALEIATEQDLDVDREMRIAGSANLLVTGVGGPPGFSDLASTLLLKKFNITQRGAGFCIAAIEALGLFYAAQIVVMVPYFVTGGLILYYGADLVRDWLLSTRKTYSLREWGVVLLIVVISVFYSFLVAILAGFLIATILFAYSYANAPVVRNVTTLANLPSTTDRSSADAALLMGSGASVRIFQLQGFLFFGTSEQVVGHIRTAAEASGSDRLKVAIVDFARVTDLDSASANAFKRIATLARSRDFSAVFSGLKTGPAETLRRVGLEANADPRIIFASDLDHALEQVEETILGVRAVATDKRPLAELFAASPEKQKQLTTLFAAMTRKKHAPQARLITAGQSADEIFFIESGRAVVQRVLPDGSAKRLRTMLAGAIVGEVAYCLGGKRTADVVAETETVTLSITSKGVAKLAKDNPELALLFNALLNRALAEKVVTANRMTEHAG